MDESKTNTLPDPELNPLLNPVLSAHMGRWAEVYFTSPPEKREEAVAELLRELKNGPAENTSGGSDLSGSDPIENDLSELDLPAATAAMPALEPVEIHGTGGEHPHGKNGVPEEVVQYSLPAAPRICSACGYKNSGKQNFCGMCGTSLQASPEAHAGENARAALSDLGLPESFVTDLRDRSDHEDPRALNGPPLHARSDREHDAEPESTSWFRQEYDLPSFAVEPEPVPYRYRLYVGVVLSILLTALVYMAWRGTQAISGSTSTQPPASKVMPPAPSSPPVAAPNPASTPTKTPNQSTVSNEPAPEAAPVKRAAEAPPPKLRGVDAKPAERVVTTAASTAPLAPEQSGSQDLATAEKYLSGSQGGTRNSREASAWLWKAVGKGNATATLELSDLYLHGDGVPKSCDQARLLLDVAARKGSRAAGYRLRNLQAFGCP